MARMKVLALPVAIHVALLDLKAKASMPVEVRTPTPDRPSLNESGPVQVRSGAPDGPGRLPRVIRTPVVDGFSAP
jgi:hypothetical protein